MYFSAHTYDGTTTLLDIIDPTRTASVSGTIPTKELTPSLISGTVDVIKGVQLTKILFNVNMPTNNFFNFFDNSIWEHGHNETTQAVSE
jgi:hypothetical protein